MSVSFDGGFPNLERYRDFCESVFATGSLVEAPPVELPQLPELEVQARWYAGEFGREFTTTDGKPVEIVQFGHWNHGAGPDFTECAVRIGDTIRGGSIEVDQELDFWESHGHGANPAFDDTVLHVYMRDSGSGGRFFTRTSQHRAVPQVGLLPELIVGDTRAVWGTLPDAKRGRCATPLADLSEGSLDSLLVGAAQYRLNQKARRFAQIAAIHSREQAIFQGVGEALGYRHNRISMAVLAQRLPIQRLQTLEPLGREAEIFGAAGFLSHDHYESSDLEAKSYLRSLWDAWWRFRDRVEPTEDRQILWTLAATRPLNHPQRRLGALAALTNHWSHFMATIPGPEETIEHDWVQPFSQYLTQLSHRYWNDHYTLKSKPSPTSLALIGRDRMHDLLGNVIFPIVTIDHPEEWSRFAKLPGSATNEKLRRAAIRLFGSKDSPLARYALKTFARQQALLQIYADFCLEDLSECNHCPFPEQLSQWGK